MTEILNKNIAKPVGPHIKPYVNTNFDIFPKKHPVHFAVSNFHLHFIY